MTTDNITSRSETLAYGEEMLSGRPGVDVACLMVFAAFLATWGLGSGPGLGLHEAIVAQGAREMRDGGDWRIPRVNGIPEIRKPPLEFWLAALSSRIVDGPVAPPRLSERAARLPSACASVLTTLLVYALGRAMFGHRAGLLCGVVMASCSGALFFSHNAQVEMELTLLMTASFTCFWLATEGKRKRGLYVTLFYVSFAASMLAKAPLPLALVGMPLAVWWFIVVPLLRRRESVSDSGPSTGLPVRLWAQVRLLWEQRWAHSAGLAAFFAIVLPWPIYVYFNVDHAVDLWGVQFLGRYAGALRSESQPFWYYVPIAFVLTAPFSLSLPEAMVSPFLRRYRKHRRGLLFALTLVGIQILFLSTSAFKRPHYLVGCVPGFALLLGPVLEHLFLAARSVPRQRTVAAIVAILLAILSGVGVGGYRVWREHPNLLWPFGLAAIVLTLGVSGSCVAFATRRRTLSFVALLSTTAVVFGWSWHAIGRSGILNRQISTVVRQLAVHGIGPGDRLTWAAGRLDNRVPYYAGRLIPPLFSPTELAERRKSPSAIPQTLLAEGAARVRNRLASDRAEYFILDANDWDRLGTKLERPVREVFRVSGRSGERRDAWVVITNDRNRATTEP